MNSGSASSFRAAAEQPDPGDECQHGIPDGIECWQCRYENEKVEWDLDLRVYSKALEIAGVYLADCGQCPDPEGLGHHTIKRGEADCGKNMMCKHCWTDYLIRKAEDPETK